MKIAPLLIAAAALAGEAPKPAARTPFTAYDEALDSAATAVDSTERCGVVLGFLRRDTAQTEARLRKEFGGAPRPSFNHLLLTKKTRLTTHLQRCMRMLSVAQDYIDRAHVFAATPSNSPGMSTRQRRLNEIKNKHNQVAKLFKS